MRVLYKTADGLTFSAQDGTLLAFEADTWLITDRTQQDVNYVKQLIAKIVAGTATEADLAEWNSATLKGSYNYTDLNRVNATMEQLKTQLESYGYTVLNYQKVQIPHSGDLDPYLWYEIDIPTPQLMENYLANVQSIRNVLELFDSTPATPDSMSELTYKMANAIEQILVDCQNVIASMALVLPKTGQPTVFCGFCWYVLEST